MRKSKISLKKIITLLLIPFILFVCTSCDSKEEEQANQELARQEQAKQEQFENGKAAFEKITTAGEECKIIMDSIYGAWYYSVCEDSSHDYPEQKIRAYINCTGLNREDVENALSIIGRAQNDALIRDYNLDLIDEDYTALDMGANELDDINISLLIVQSILAEDGKYEEIENKLAEAKELMKQMTEEYDDYTKYTNLKKYYSEVSSYFEFVGAPTGSFAQLKTTIDNYETNIRTYKNDLSFIFE